MSERSEESTSATLAPVSPGIRELLDQLDRRFPEKEYQDIRRHPRYPYRHSLSAAMLPATQEIFPITTRNISAGGIGFICQRKCRSGERLMALLPLGQDVLVAHCQIIHVKQLPSGFYENGARLLTSFRAMPDNIRIPADWIGLVAGTTGWAPIRPDTFRG